MNANGWHITRGPWLVVVTMLFSVTLHNKPYTRHGSIPIRQMKKQAQREEVAILSSLSKR